MSLPKQKEAQEKLNEIENQLRKAYQDNKKLQADNQKLNKQLNDLQTSFKSLQEAESTKINYEQKIFQEKVQNISQEITNLFSNIQEVFRQNEYETFNIDDQLQLLQKITTENQPVRNCQQLIKSIKCVNSKVEPIFSNIVKNAKQNQSNKEQQLEVAKKLDQQVQSQFNIQMILEEKNRLVQEILSLRDQQYQYQKTIYELKNANNYANQQVLILNKKLQIQQTNAKQVTHQNLELEGKVIDYQNELMGVSKDKIKQQYWSNSQEKLNELDDIYKVFKNYFRIIDGIIEQMPWPTIRDCLKEFQYSFKTQFNLNQEVRDYEQQLLEIEKDTKRVTITKDDYLVSSRTKNDQNSRFLMDNLRSTIQDKGNQILERENEIDALLEQYQYMCNIEKRRFECQLEQEKLLITTRQQLTALEGAQNSNGYTQSSDYGEILDMQKRKYQCKNIKQKKNVENNFITFEPNRREDEDFKNILQIEQKDLQQLITSTRQKLSKQIQNALYS